MSADVMPLLEILRMTGLSFVVSNAGVSSEGRLYKLLGGLIGTAVVKTEELSRIIKSNTEFSMAAQGRYIRLPDTHDGRRSVSPLIYVDGDFSQAHPRFCVQLILAAHNADGDEPECLLLRFESPEGNDPAGKGKHDYYHSQLCKELRKTGPGNTFTVPDCVSWSALSCPAWPLDAQSPTHLLACVIFALYGKIEGANLLRQAYRDKFSQRLSGMHFQFEPGAPAPTRRRKTKRR